MKHFLNFAQESEIEFKTLHTSRIGTDRKLQDQAFESRGYQGFEFVTPEDSDPLLAADCPSLKIL